MKRLTSFTSIILLCAFTVGIYVGQAQKKNKLESSEQQVYATPQLAGSSPTIKPMVVQNSQPSSPEWKIQPIGGSAGMGTTGTSLSRAQLSVKMNTSLTMNPDGSLYSGPENQTSPQIATDGSTMYAAFEDADTKSGLYPYGSIQIYQSLDGGVTWAYWGYLYDPTAQVVYPRISIAGGYVILSFLDAGYLGTIRYNQLTGIGTTAQVSTPTFTTTDYIIEQRLCSDAIEYPATPYLYLAYLYKQTDGNIAVLFSRSTDLAGTWQTYQPLGYTVQGLGKSSVGLEFGASGLYVSYLGSGLNNGLIMMRKSTSFGASGSWSVETSLPQSVYGGPFAKIGPVLSATGQRVAVVYQYDYYNDATNWKTATDLDIYGIFSSDGGATWRERIVAGGPENEILPAISHDADSSFYVGFLRNNKMCVSMAGTQFAFSTPDSSTSGTASTDLFPSIVGSPTSSTKKAYAVWTTVSTTLDINRSSIALSIPPPAPSNLTATVFSSSQINLSWTDNSSDENQFNIYQRTGGTGLYYFIFSTASNISVTSVSELSPGTQYEFYVRAVNSYGNSATSNIAGGTTTGTSASGLVARYKLDGTAMDTSGFNNNGTINGGYAFVADRFNATSGALDFNGTTTYIDCGNNASLTMGNAVTMSAWIKPRVITDGRIISKAPSYEIDMYNSALRFNMNGSNDISADISPYLNTWTFVTATWDGAVENIYINGELKSSTSHTFGLNSTTLNLCIGRSPGGLSYYNGLIDDARVYNRALRPGEIDTLYHAGGWAPPPPTITSFFPKSGKAGDNISLTGGNFNATANKNIVYFGDVKGTVTSASASLLRVTVPTGAIYAPITVIDTVSRLSASSAEPFHIQWSNNQPLNSALFASRINLSTSRSPYGIATPDIDGDGKADVLTSCQSTANTVLIHQNTSTVGNFQIGSTNWSMGTGTSPSYIATGDLDGDGRLDAVVPWENSSKITVHRNNSSGIGSFDFPTTLTLATLSGPTDVALGDLDGDGRLDIVVATTGSSTVSVFLNTSTSASGLSFALMLNYPVNANPRGVALADLDGDGKLDIISTDYNSNTGATFSVLHNTTSSPGALSFDTYFSVPTSNGPYSVAVTDMDGDDKLDICIGSNNGISIHRNIYTSGTLSAVSFASALTPGQPSQRVAFSDLDSDGKPDLIGVIPSTDQVVLYRNISVMGTITLAPAVLISTGSTPTGVSIADFDGDGKSDIFTANNVGTTFSVIRNMGMVSQLGESFVDANTALLMHMNEASGTVVGDNSVFSNNGTATGTTIVPGRFGNARNFQTGSDKVTVPSGPLSVGSNPFTIDWWMQTTSIAANTIVFDKYLISGYRFFLDVGGYPRAFISDGTNNAIAPTSISIADGKWHHLAMTRDASFLRVYIDGVVLGQVSSTNVGNIDNAASLLMNSSGYIGLIDEIRVSYIARTPDSFNLQLPPKNVTAQIVGGNSVQLQWASGGGAVGAFRYRIYTGSDSVNVVLQDSVYAPTYISPVLAPGTYFARITAIDSTGFESRKSFAVKTVVGVNNFITFQAKMNIAMREGRFNPTVDSVIIRGVYNSWTSNTDRLLDPNADSIFTGTFDVGTATPPEYKFVIRHLGTDLWERQASTNRTYTPTGNPQTLPILYFDDDSIYTPQPPTITDFTPPSGSVGTTVTILGTNFNPISTNNIVYFGAVKGTVTSGTRIGLTVTLPTGTTYAPITVTDTITHLTGSSTIPFKITFTSNPLVDVNSFASPINFAFDNGPYGLALGDIDRDGKGDLAVANYNFTNFVSLFRNTSSPGTISAGSLAPKVDLSAEVNPQSPIFADFDGDGKLDLAVVNLGPDNISVFQNISATGSISSSSFAPKVEYSTGANPYSLAAADIDGDGRLDLLATNSASGTFSVLRNTGTLGTFTTSSFAPKVDFAAGSNPISIAVGDLDGDRKSDVVVANSSGSTISIYRNISVQGTIDLNSFASRIDIAVGNSPSSVALGDLDGDGKLDIVVTSQGVNLVSVFHNISASGSLTAGSFAARVDFTTEALPKGLALSDVDGDGKLDICVANQSNNSVSVFQNISTAGNITTGSFGARMNYAASGSPSYLLAGDMDSDGKPDLITANSSGNNLSVFRNVSTFINNSITFQVKMNIAMREGRFNPAVDSVIVRGNYPSNLWASNADRLLDPNADSIYTGTFNVDTTTLLQYKFVFRHLGIDLWERQTGTDRTYTTTGSPQTLPAVYFDDDSVYTPSISVGLMAWYPFNGAANDSSANGNGGALNGGYAFVADRFNITSNALDCNGTNTYIDCGTSPYLTMMNAVSLSAWIKPRVITDGRIISKAPSYEIDMYNSQLRFNMNGSNDITADISPYVNQWVFVTATWDGATEKIYLNDVLKSSVPHAGTINSTTQNLNIGRSPGGVSYYNGLLDDARVYDRALRPGEIDTLYHAGGWAPTFTVRQIQEVSNTSLELANTIQSTDIAQWTLQTSPYMNDTVTVTGVVVIPPKVNNYTSFGYNMLIADNVNSSDPNWRGLFVRILYSTTADTINFQDMLSLKAGDLVQLTGRVDEFPVNTMNSITQFGLLPSTLQVLGTASVPAAVSKLVSDFYQGRFPNGTVRYTTGEPLEGSIVQLTNLTVDSLFSSTAGTVVLTDASGNTITTYDASKWFTLRTHRDPLSTFRTPEVGSVLSLVRGWITPVSGVVNNPRGYQIAPQLPGDMNLPPLMPNTLSMTGVTQTSLNLSWVDNSNDELGFKVERKTGATGTYTEIASVDSNVTSYQNTGLSGSTQYYYRVRAYNAAGYSGYTPEANATTSGAGNLITFQVKMNIAMREGRFNPASDSVIVRGNYSSLPWISNTDRLLDPNADSVYTGTFNVDTTSLLQYKFVIRHLGTDLWERQTGTNRAYTTTGSPQTLPAVYFDDDSIYTPALPAAPSALTATAVASTQINLSWTDNSNNEDGFMIERSTNAGITWTEITIVAAGVTSYQNTGLSPSTIYHYRVRAYNNAAGVSTYSNIVNATTLAPGTLLFGEYKPDGNTILLLHMNESIGSAVSDASNNANNGTATGTTIVPGRFGNARNFPGNDQVTIPSSTSLNVGVNDFTIDAWVYRTAASGVRILSKGIYPNQNHFLFNLLSDGQINFQTGDGATAYSVSGGSVPAGKWQHVAAVRKSTSYLLFQNGVLVKSSLNATTHSLLNTNPACIGAESTLSGTIDELRFSRIQRDPSEFGLQLPPKNLQATVTGSDVTLNWQNGGGAIGCWYYKIHQGTDSTNLTSSDSVFAPTITKTKAGIPAGTYYLRVSAVDSTGFESVVSYAAKVTIVGGTVVPAISSIIPVSAAPGSAVSILGTNFSPTYSANTVYFGSVKGTVIGAASTLLTVIIPYGAIYAPISVTVNGLVASSLQMFTPTFAGPGTGIKSSSLGSAMDSPAGLTPNRIALGDFDLDGRSDIVVVNGTLNKFSILRNLPPAIGTISLATPTVVLTGASPTGIAVGDIDGDGFLDVAVAEAGSNNVSIFRNNSTVGSGAITFAAKTSFAVGAGPDALALGDLDNDGKLDLVCVNKNDGTISILLNKSTPGTISFPSGQTIGFASASTSDIALGDIDGDTKIDIVAAGAGNFVTIFRNLSSSGIVNMASGVNVPIGGSAHIGLADLDLDGKLDIVGTTVQNKISIIRNTSSTGSISFMSALDFASETSSDVKFADIDGDTKVDIIVTNASVNNVSVYQNMSSTGSIQLSTRVDFPTSSGSAYGAVGDLDGDGKPDVIVETGSAISTLRNTTATGGSTAPAAPRNLTSIAGNAQVTLKWNKNTESNFLRYRIYSGILSGGETKADSTTGGITDTTKIMTGLFNGATYYFTVTAVNNAGQESAFSNEVSALPSATITIPSTPSNLAASATSSTAIRLTWADMSGNEDGFKIERSVGNNTNFVDLVSPPSNTTSYDDGGLSASTTYYYKIRAYNTAGNSNWSNEASATTLGVTPVPGTPTATQASNITSSSFQANWNAASNATSYYLDVAGDYGFTNIVFTNVNVGNVTSYTVSSLSASTAYYYRVRASGIGGTSSNSNVISLTTGSAGPAVPTAMEATTVTTSRFRAQWNSSTGATSYRLDVSTDNSFASFVGVYSNFSVGNVTSYDVTGLSASTNYYYRVRAENGSGTSSNSNTITVTTLSIPQITHTPYSGEVTVSNGTALSISINASATDPAGVQSMYLQWRKAGSPSVSALNYSYPYSNTQFVVLQGSSFVGTDNKAIGVDYRIVATNTLSVTNATLWYSISVRNAASTVVQPAFTLPTAANLPSTELVKAYRIFSVPYDLDDKSPVFLSAQLGDHAKDGTQYYNWRLQRITGGAKQDYEAFKNQQVVAPGAGFFLILRNTGATVSVTGTKIVKSSDMETNGVQLSGGMNGWYLLGTPMDITIPWDSLVFVGATYMDRAQYTGDGPVSGWIKGVSTLNPWEGVAVKMSGDCTVKFKSGTTSGLPKNAMTPKMIADATPEIPASPNDWQVTVDAYRTDINMRSEGNAIGMRTGADAGHDQFDSYQPPLVGDKTVALGFSGSNGALMRDIRPLDENGGVWNMRVITGDAGARVKLNFGRVLSFPDPSFEIYLIDADQKMAYNLKNSSTLEIGSGTGVRDFQVVVGKRSFVEANNAGVDLHPSAMTLYPNYPNPFNPQTVIRYTIPNTSVMSQVRLTVFNVLGQEVATLVKGEQPSGYYEVTFNGMYQSSGVYFYRLVVSDGMETSSDVKKMVLIK